MKFLASSMLGLAVAEDIFCANSTQVTDANMGTFVDTDRLLTRPVPLGVPNFIQIPTIFFSEQFLNNYCASQRLGEAPISDGQFTSSKSVNIPDWMQLSQNADTGLFEASYCCEPLPVTVDCPTDCWEILDNKCVPKAEATELVCRSDGMDASLNACLFKDNDRYEASLIDSADANCQAAGSLTDFFTLSTVYDGCGTTATIVEDGINFEQTISVQTYSGQIKLANPTEVSFSCFFNSTVDVTSNSTVSEAEASTGTAGTGAFAFDMDIYANENFNALADDSQVLGERLHFAIASESLPSNVDFTVDSCTVTNEESGMAYEIVSNGCPAGIVGLDFMTDAPFTHDSPSQVSFMNFRFDIGTPNNETQANTIACQITACDASDESSTCKASKAACP